MLIIGWCHGGEVPATLVRHSIVNPDGGEEVEHVEQSEHSLDDFGRILNFDGVLHVLVVQHSNHDTILFGDSTELEGTQKLCDVKHFEPVHGL